MPRGSTGEETDCNTLYLGFATKLHTCIYCNMKTLTHLTYLKFVNTMYLGLIMVVNIGYRSYWIVVFFHIR